MMRTTCFTVALLGLAIGCGATDAPVTSNDPTGFTFQSAPGSLASFGWTGFEHDIEEPDGTPFGVTTTACHDGVCEFQGPADPGGKVHRRRCLFRMSTECTTDGDCPSDGMNPTPCVYIYDAPITQPLPGSDGKVGACAWSYIPVNAAGKPPTISGKLNLATGALDLTNLTVLLGFNANANGTFRGACGECVDDPTPDDGIRQGKCRYAMNIGDPATAAVPDRTPDKDLPCDINRNSKLNGFAGNYSMDCSPTVIHSERPGLAFGGSFKSGGIQIKLRDSGPMPDDGPNCTAGSGQCFCGMCPDNTTACMQNSDCGAQGPCRNPVDTDCRPAAASDVLMDRTLSLNQCRSDRTKFAAYSNGCMADCDWNDATGLGTCPSKANPSVMIRCYPNKDGILVSGHAERDDHVGTIYRVNTGAASCIAAGAIPQLNSQLGLPGLLFQKRNFQIIPVYAEAQP